MIYTLETKCRTFSFLDDVTTWWWLDSKALDRAWRSFCQTVSDRADAALEVNGNWCGCALAKLLYPSICSFSLTESKQLELVHNRGFSANLTRSASLSLTFKKLTAQSWNCEISAIKAFLQRGLVQPNRSSRKSRQFNSTVIFLFNPSSTSILKTHIF